MIDTLHQRGFIQQASSVFILLGISSSQQEIERFKSLGVQEYTTKPLSEQTMMEAYHKYGGGDTAKQHA
jgi:CheY-like chemotaxis protein